ncbi:uncharacterized protein LOC131679832 [Topomyia yanbarensis]|uniref:uncharacterized protein LOC131679832 n=1 Tax=Topomyia yanbarensis TaxID=2498891 RepID=UPI00273A8966|nr:uncharacterized protein LOC131679832 [Topomyia yanbarensis]
MDKKQCGECHHEINDLEPVRCGLCEIPFHVSQNCCGFNPRSCKDVFAQGKAVFICIRCRDELNGRSIREYITDQNRNNISPSASTDDISKQIQQLSGIVEVLGKKVDCIANSNQTPKPSVSREMRTPMWPGSSSKRRRIENSQSARPAVDRSTNSIDFGDLSVAFITPVAPPPRFWLYLSGFQPLISNDDVQKIVSRCLDLADPFDVTRLVPKGKDVTNMNYVSFKIGLDPALKQQALNAACWPAGLMFREFVELPKNTMRRPFIFAREQPAATPTQEQPFPMTIN